MYLSHTQRLGQPGHPSPQHTAVGTTLPAGFVRKAPVRIEWVGGSGIYPQAYNPTTGITLLWDYFHPGQWTIVSREPPPKFYETILGSWFWPVAGGLVLFSLWQIWPRKAAVKTGQRVKGGST